MLSVFVAALAADPLIAPPQAAAAFQALPAPIAETDVREFAAIAGRDGYSPAEPRWSFASSIEARQGEVETLYG